MYVLETEIYVRGKDHAGGRSSSWKDHPHNIKYGIRVYVKEDPAGWTIPTTLSMEFRICVCAVNKGICESEKLPI